MKNIPRSLLWILLILAAVLIQLVSCSTSGGANNSVLLEFDSPPGIYPTRFLLKVNCNNPSLEIRYTLDCSIPTATSNLYQDDGIQINYRGGGLSDPSSVNIIRCAAFDSEGNRVGEPITGTYIISELPDIRYSTMIVSIVCEPGDLYDYVRGILVPGKIRDDFKKNRPSYWTNDSLQDANFFQSGIEWERPAHVEFYTKDGDLLLKQNMGIRVSGGWNRNNEHKSLRLFARYSYAPTNVMSFDAYPGLTSLTGVPVSDFKTLILRTGSNNMWNTTIQTPFLMQLGEEIGIETMHYRPICVYLNGKYYGFMALMEDYGTTYFETNYNIPSDEITCINGAGKISGGREWSLDNGPESELREFNKMMAYITTLDMRDETYYKKASEMLDFDNFIKYMCFQGYISNSDWPQNNVRVWRRYTDGYNPDATEYGYDGRWRFLLKDLDLAAGYSADKVTESIFKRLDSDDGSLRLNAIFKSLFRNPDFKNRVYCFLCDLLSTTMQVDNVMAKLGEVEASALLEMRYYTKSYNASGGSPEKWHTHLETPARFFINRYNAVYSDIQKKYNSVFGKLEVKIEGEGSVKLSTLTLNSDISLEYLVGLNLPVSAEPAKGWKIKELKVGGKEIDGSFMMSAKNLTLEAVFEPDPNYSEPKFGLVFNELKYNHTRLDESADLIELYNASDKPIYLKGYMLVKEGLRDDGTTDKDEWSFPSVTIRPGEYMVIACDKLGTRKGQSDYHASFSIGIGDRLTIVDRLGNEVDNVTLINCNNFAVLARDGSEWYFEPYGTFGYENVKHNGYLLSNVIDDRARGVFIHKGKFINNFAEGQNGNYVITERSIRENFGSDTFDKNKAKFDAAKRSGGYDLDKVLDILGYRKYYIASLDSYVVFKK
jgi:hypothetical protein